MGAQGMQKIDAGPQKVEATRMASALDLLDGSSGSLIEASHATAVTDRYGRAQLAALRAAAAVLAVRGPRLVGRGNSPGPRDLWQLLPLVAPELGEWATFFAYTGRRRHAAPATGDSTAVSVRDADDLVRSAQQFHDQVRTLLGLTRRTAAATTPGDRRLTPAVAH